jgi:hypothetical protein
VSRFPKLYGIRVHRVLMGPGDALFVPWAGGARSPRWISVTITHTTFRWPNDFQAAHHRRWRTDPAPRAGAVPAGILACAPRQLEVLAS